MEIASNENHEGSFLPSFFVLKQRITGITEPSFLFNQLVGFTCGVLDLRFYGSKPLTCRVLTE
jgi:hypothetical protein